MWILNNRAAVCKAFLVAGIITGLAACSDQALVAPRTVPPSSRSTVATVQGQHRPNEDDKLVDLARQIPGLGGVSFDQSGSIQVVLTDLSKATLATPIVRSFLNGRSAVDDGQSAATAPVQFVRGQFTFPQLKAWKDSLRQVVFSDTGVTFLDADEYRNRVTVGIADPTAEARVQRLMAPLGVPAGLVRFEVRAHSSARSTLRNFYSPQIAGLQIEFSGYLCTMGLVVSYNYIGNYGFVTAAHCSDAQYQGGSTQYSQGGVPIGYKVNDVPLFRDSYGCPPGRWCRNSDALVALFNDGYVEDYGIAFTSLPPCYNSSCSSRLGIGGEMPVTGGDYAVAGMQLNKTGRTTGWTRGTVNNTCADTEGPAMYYPPAGGFIVPLLLCQISTSIWSEGGDSGSPVYSRVTYVAGDPGQATIFGIMWGGPTNNFNITYVSPMSGVENDVGSLTYR